MLSRPVPCKMLAMWLTIDPQANELLTRNSFALLLGMQLDQQIPMEKAFRGPYELARRMCEAGRCIRVDELSADLIAATPVADLVEVFRVKPALHRFPEAMAKRAHHLSVLRTLAMVREHKKATKQQAKQAQS
ncbi:MAG: hypothetical protein ACRDPW_06060 [Mycobacteriales bacterium]